VNTNQSTGEYEIPTRQQVSMIQVNTN